MTTSKRKIWRQSHSIFTKLAIAIFLIFSVGVASTTSADELRGSLGVLALNVNGMGSSYENEGSSSGTDWETRAARIAVWAKRNQVVPDIFVLQEVHGWLWTFPLRSCGRGFASNVGDYDQIDILLSALRDKLGVSYRIAYLTGKEYQYGVIPCKVYHAQAVLYNPARLVNITPQVGVSQAHNAVTGLYGVPHLRRSLPLCNRGTNLMPLQSLIDGPPQTDKCGVQTPSGPAWAVFSEQGHIAASFVRLAFVDAPTKTVDVFNVHPNANQEQIDKSLIARLIEAMEPPPYSDSSLYYPPILAGDFNSLGVDQDFPGFSTVFAPPTDPSGSTDPMLIGIGTSESVPIQYRARAVQRLVLPDLPQGVYCPGTSELLVSDHCGLFVRFEWDGADAGALRGVFIDGPQSVVAYQSYQLNAKPSGGGPAYAYRWQPGGTTTSYLDAQAGAPNTIQDWTLEITDARTGKISSGHYLVKAKPTETPRSECLKACRADNAACTANVPTPGGPRPSECAAELKACLANCPPSPGRNHEAPS